MKKALYIEAFSGISGNMLLGARVPINAALTLRILT